MVELDKFEFTSLKLGHYEKKVEIYVLYERVFDRNFPKIDFFWPKSATKWYFLWFYSRAEAREKFFEFLGLEYPQRAPFLPLNFVLGSS